MSDQTYVIVGASLAGAKAAETLREEGFDGTLVLVGEESHRPYERPPLTKDYLRGESEREKAFVHGEDFYRERNIELLTDTAAVSVAAADRRVTLSNGRELTYDRLLLATGAAPRTLDVSGADLDGIFTMRTIGDSDALRERIDAGGSAAVVGAGWIGSEFAASARQRGLEVTLIDPLTLPNERIFGAEIGGFYRDVHAQHGVQLALGEGVEAFEGEGRVERVRTSSGRAIDCDFAVVGIGVIPRLELAESAGAELDNGIAVDASLLSSVPGVYAAGDVASAWHPFLERRVRVEHWSNALNQGPAAARSMLGQQVSYDRIPYFFSDQYDVGMEYSGYATEWDEVVFRGDRDGGEFIAFWLKDGRVLAGMNVNVWDVAEDIQKLIRSRQTVDRAKLTDTDTPLDRILLG
jgi:3-phenylpropionate/trans-cinnamate dioxygenase ferredoxin reductase subunit